MTPVATSITLKIADSLIVRSVYSVELGRLMFLRVVGQNAVIVELPHSSSEGHRARRAGSLRRTDRAAGLDREATSSQDRSRSCLQPEPRYIYSNRSYWYPQATVADYATAG